MDVYDPPSITFVTFSTPLFHSIYFTTFCKNIFHYQTVNYIQFWLKITSYFLWMYNIYFPGCNSRTYWARSVMKINIGSAYTKNEINYIKITKHIRRFQLSLGGGGGTYSKIDDLYVCPPNIILDFFRLLVIPNT